MPGIGANFRACLSVLVVPAAWQPGRTSARRTTKMVAERMVRRLAAATVFGCAAALAASLTSAPGLALPSAGLATGPRPSSGPAKPGLMAGAGEELLHVSAVSASDAWAVGETQATPSRSVILHWNGTAWSKVAIPGPSVNGLVGVSASSADNAWLVGVHCSDQCATQTTLILHWNGTAWARVPSPNPAGQ